MDGLPVRPLAVAMTLVSGLLLASPAFAESVRIHESESESESVRYSSDENGTVMEKVETKSEVRSEESEDGERATIRISTDENDTPTVIKSESFRRVICFGVPGSGVECTEETGSGSQAGSFSWFGNMTSGDWWRQWGNRIVESLGGGSVLAETSISGIGSMEERTEARLARRVCNHADADDQEECLEDAVEGEGATIRDRLQEWIERLFD